MNFPYSIIDDFNRTYHDHQNCDNLNDKHFNQDTLERLTTEDFKAFVLSSKTQSDFYRKNTELILCSTTVHSKIIMMIDKYFSFWKNRVIRYIQCVTKSIFYQ